MENDLISNLHPKSLYGIEKYVYVSNKNMIFTYFMNSFITSHFSVFIPQEKGKGIMFENGNNGVALRRKQ